ncbi:class F sortase [Kitasatospora viridis]|uniref:Sortase family protein n=1 Tax=Kitasatospora viridis TaxID=281105 RepID=A0A561S975_9ACTN|nr:class F sortase [Kitasatospora viridis]TWF71420.1 sortase family protein [Kitasatospora viridis]
MPTTDRRPARRRRGAGRLTAATAAGALLCGGWLITDGASAPAGPPQPEPVPSAPAPSTPAPGTATPAPSRGPVLPPSPPARLRIRALKLNATVTPLGLDDQGRLTTPPAERHDLTGWYRGSATPGENGTTVIVGHVDDRRGPSVFFLLGRLHPGSTVTLTREDRRTVTFTVDAVRSYPKADFPTAQVYAATGRPELRLITCGGHYDHRTGYQANTVVFAHLTGIG